jgi:hypothetical protein
MWAGWEYVEYIESGDFSTTFALLGQNNDVIFNFETSTTLNIGNSDLTQQSYTNSIATGLAILVILLTWVTLRVDKIGDWNRSTDKKASERQQTEKAEEKVPKN